MERRGYDPMLQPAGRCLSGHIQGGKSVEKVGRNEPCPCGSGKKYKQCHLGQELEQARDPIGSQGPKVFAAIAAVGLASAGLGMGFGSDVGTIALGLGLVGLAAFFILKNMPPPGGGGKDPGAINFGG